MRELNRAAVPCETYSILLLQGACTLKVPTRMQHTSAMACLSVPFVAGTRYTFTGTTLAGMGVRSRVQALDETRKENYELKLRMFHMDVCLVRPHAFISALMSSICCRFRQRWQYAKQRMQSAICWHSSMWGRCRMPI